MMVFRFRDLPLGDFLVELVELVLSDSRKPRIKVATGLLDGGYGKYGVPTTSRTA
jgi:hypothetical protein